ncbi:LysR family transcriptional regulator [Vibrio mexicanus]|uniref:LysR family transcriptional regulator n=1 Tax=Vibrio mexicanus TaxID=1004326 RepID=UPI00063C78FB|nr:LysR family transcriptional regulator [Vibrio mexicanus]
MHDKQLYQIDFNSLKLLKILGEERNTKRASERMYLSQSAVSKALKKLRGYFGDDLFVRKQYGLKPTPYCEELLKKLPVAFEVIDEIFRDLDKFEPEEYNDDISIAIGSSIYHWISLPLYTYLKQHLPNATIKLLNWNSNTEHELKVGSIHLGINFYPLDVSKSLLQRKLVYNDFMLVCREGHPVLDSERRAQDIGQYPLALLELPDFSKERNLIEHLLLAEGIVPKIHLRADELSLCLSVVANSDLLLPTSEPLDSAQLPEGTTLVVPHPDNKIGRHVGLFTAVRTANTPMMHWLIEQIETLCKKEPKDLLI